MYRVPIVIYMITCKMMNNIYIGNTQQNLLEEDDGPLSGCQKLLEKGVFSDSYARQFSGIWPRGAASPLPGMQ
jgi:hypothetical protein